jgi:hypothetical protein
MGTTRPPGERLYPSRAIRGIMFAVVAVPLVCCTDVDKLRGHAPISAPACSSQNCMSISRNIAVAVVRCPSALDRSQFRPCVN